MIASQNFFNNNVDENTFSLLRENYLEICRIVLTKTNTEIR
jgi:hypothetical protein